MSKKIPFVRKVFLFDKIIPAALSLFPSSFSPNLIKAAKLSLKRRDTLLKLELKKVRPALFHRGIRIIG